MLKKIKFVKSLTDLWGGTASQLPDSTYALADLEMHADWHLGYVSVRYKNNPERLYPMHMVRYVEEATPGVDDKEADEMFGRLFAPKPSDELGKLPDAVSKIELDTDDKPLEIPPVKAPVARKKRGSGRPKGSKNKPKGKRGAKAKK